MTNFLVKRIILPEHEIIMGAWFPDEDHVLTQSASTVVHSASEDVSRHAKQNVSRSGCGINKISTSENRADQNFDIGGAAETSKIIYNIIM